MLQDPAGHVATSFFHLGGGNQSNLYSTPPRRSFFEQEEEKGGLPHSFIYVDEQISLSRCDLTANSFPKENINPKSRSIKKEAEKPTRKSSRKRKPRVLDSDSDSPVRRCRRDSSSYPTNLRQKQAGPSAKVDECLHQSISRPRVSAAAEK